MTDKTAQGPGSGSDSDEGTSTHDAVAHRKPHKPTTTDRLILYSEIATQESLAQLGDLDSGAPRSATSSLELDSVTSTGQHTPPQHRRMRVDVTLSISNDGKCPPSPDDPIPPCPPHRHKKWFASCWPWLALAAVVLALLALAALNHLGRQSDHSGNSGQSGTTVIGTTNGSSNDVTSPEQSAVPSPSVVPNSPTALRLDDTVMPGNTVVLNQLGDVKCDGQYHTVNQVPEFAILHTQNWVHDAATQWQIRCVENLGGATVVALDASHNVINRQIYGANYHFEQQLTFVQTTDSAGSRVVQIDFYAPFNTFLGRTIYRFDASNRISDAYRQDGFQRPLQASHFARDQNGTITSMVTEKTARNGGGRDTAYTQPDIEAATRAYYMFDGFN